MRHLAFDVGCERPDGIDFPFVPRCTRRGVHDFAALYTSFRDAFQDNSRDVVVLRCIPVRIYAIPHPKRTMFSLCITQGTVGCALFIHYQYVFLYNVFFNILLEQLTTATVHLSAFTMFRVHSIYVHRVWLNSQVNSNTV